MKLVTRQQFMRMPKGTVFCKFPLSEDGDGCTQVFGIERPSIFDGAIQDHDGSYIDFFYAELGALSVADVHRNTTEKLFEMQEHLGMEVPFEQLGERDGLFEDDSVGFAIYSREEVQGMIDLLQEALKTAY